MDSLVDAGQQGVFEDGGDDDGAAVVEEFFPGPAGTDAGSVPGKPGLREKLIRQGVNAAGVGS